MNRRLSSSVGLANDILRNRPAPKLGVQSPIRDDLKRALIFSNLNHERELFMGAKEQYPAPCFRFIDKLRSIIPLKSYAPQQGPEYWSLAPARFRFIHLPNRQSRAAHLHAAPVRSTENLTTSSVPVTRQDSVSPDCCGSILPSQSLFPYSKYSNRVRRRAASSYT